MPRPKSADDVPRFWVAVWDHKGEYQGIHRYSDIVIRMMQLLDNIVIKVSHATID